MYIYHCIVLLHESIFDNWQSGFDVFCYDEIMLS